MDILIGATANCSNGTAGQVTQLIADRASMRVTHVVVKEARRPHGERMVPFGMVQRSRGHAVRLRCSGLELSTMQPATRTELVESEALVHGGSSYHDHSIYSLPRLREAEYQNLAETECALGANTRVRATDGNAGRLAGLTVEPASGDITHVLFQHRQSRLLRTLTMPVAAIAEMSSGVVYVRSSRDSLMELPPASAQTRR